MKSKYDLDQRSGYRLSGSFKRGDRIIPKVYVDGTIWTIVNPVRSDRPNAQLVNAQGETRTIQYRELALGWHRMGDNKTKLSKRPGVPDYELD